MFPGVSWPYWGGSDSYRESAASTRGSGVTVRSPWDSHSRTCSFLTTGTLQCTILNTSSQKYWGKAFHFIRISLLKGQRWSRRERGRAWPWEEWHSPTTSTCCPITQSCLTLCDRMNRSTPGFLILHHVLEFAQTHVHWVGDAIQPSHPLSSPSPPALIFPTIRVFSNESALHTRWWKPWSFSFGASG